MGGWCYHYSNPIWPNKVWKELQEDETGVPRNIEVLLDKNEKEDEKRFRQAVEDLGQDDQPDGHEYPWWGPEQCISGEGHIARYNPYQKFVASRVCKALSCGWWAHHNQSAERGQ